MAAEDDEEDPEAGGRIMLYGIVTQMGMHPRSVPSY